MICMAYMGIWGAKIIWLFFWNGLNPKKAVVVDNGEKWEERTPYDYCAFTLLQKWSKYVSFYQLYYTSDCL